MIFTGHMTKPTVSKHCVCRLLLDSEA